MAGFSLWPLAAVPRGGGLSAVPFLRGRMRGWVFWALVISVLVLAVTYNYMWETDFSYWVGMQVRGILRYIGL